MGVVIIGDCRASLLLGVTGAAGEGLGGEGRARAPRTTRHQLLLLLCQLAAAGGCA